MKMLKKGLAMALALMMLVMAVPFGGLAVYAAQEDYPAIELGVTTEAVIEDGYAYFWFTPTESGWYQFYSIADNDTYGYIYDADGYQLAYNDDSAGDGNFRVTYNMEAGVTYKLGARYYSHYSSGSFPVCVDIYEPRVVTGIEIDDVSYLSYELQDYDYVYPVMRVFYSDGSSSTTTGDMVSDETDWYELQYEYSTPYEEWEEGGVYTATYSMDIRGVVYSGEYTITIEACPIVSIQCQPLSVVEHYSGYWTSESYWDEELGEYVHGEYFRYNNLYPRATIVMRDGTVHEDANGFEWNGQWYSLYLNQSYKNHLEFGHNTLTGTVLGFEYSADVEVMDTPIASIEFNPISVIEHYNGYWSKGTDWDDEKQEDVYYTYYYYYGLYPTATVVMKDGTVYENVSGFEWNNSWYEFDLEQNYKNCLELGSNQLSGNVLNYEYTVEVIVEPSPIASITFAPSAVIEHSNGYWNTGSYWDAELEEQVEVEYFYYYNIRLNATITMRDGTVYEGDFEWNDGWYSLGIEQSALNHLTLGMNHMTGSVLGYDYAVDIEVIESPVVSVEVQPITRVQYTNGYWDNDWYYDENNQRVYVDFFYYRDVYPTSNNTIITLKDGSVIHDNYFEWNGVEYGINYSGQWAKQYLQLGVNEWEASIAGYDFTYNIETIDTPIASVEIAPITVVENRDGYWNSDSYWDDNDEYVEVDWFYYYSNNIMPRLNVTMKDGTAYVNCTGFEWNGYWYSMSVDGQSARNHLKPGANTWHGSILGYEFEYTINVSTLGSNDAFEYMESDDSVIITNCYLGDATVEVPATINGKPVVGVASLSNAWSTLRNLILPDSVTYIGEYMLNNLEYLESVHFGAGIANLTAEMFGYASYLKSITISENNPNYCVVNRALHNKSLDTFIAYPTANENIEYVVPATVVNLENLEYYYIYRSLIVTYPEDHIAYISIDGVVYNKEMTKVISCRKDKTGDYVMPETVEEIADGAFMSTKLTSVVVSPKVTEIVYCAFASCASLESVTLPDGLISIEQSAFEQTFSLKEINLPDTLEYIGYYSFYRTGLNDLVVPGSVQRIDDCAFYNSQVTNLTLNEGIVEIGGMAFGETPVRSVILPDSVTYLGAYAFNECHDLQSLHIGSGIDAIQKATFYDAWSLQNITIPPTVSYVGSSAFSNSGVTKLILSEGVTEIGSSAFKNCNYLQAVHFPASLNYVASTAFNSCDALRTLTMAQNGQFYFAKNNCLISHEGMLTVGCNGSVIPNDGSVTGIADYAFSDCDGLTEAIIPDTVTYLGLGAFSGTDSLVKVQIGDGLEFMGSGAFEGSAVSDLDLGNSITYIAPYGFQNSGLREVFIPSSVTDIMYDAFSGSEYLTSVEIPLSVESIEQYAFGGCYNLTDVYYQGTEADRDNMYIAWGNGYLLDATWHYEHTNDKWAALPACEHEYDDVCDSDCNLCGRPRKAPHAYENTCSEYCPLCDQWREVQHTYDNVCDASCNVCGAERWVEGHWYDNACDATCNNCGTVREVSHYFDDVCAEACIECGWIRDDAADHVYDSKYDTECNGCGKIRDAVGPVIFKVDNVTARPGETFDVAIRLENNSGLVGFHFNVYFDETQFELIDAQAADIFGTASYGPMQSPFSVLWIDAVHPEVVDNGVIVTLTFRAKADAAFGAYDISVGLLEDEVLDGNMDNVPYETVSGGVTLKDKTPGDADGDGELNMKDLGLLLQYLNAWDVTVDISALDVNSDGKVNNRDYALIQRYLNGWDVELY